MTQPYLPLALALPAHSLEAAEIIPGPPHHHHHQRFRPYLVSDHCLTDDPVTRSGDSGGGPGGSGSLSRSIGVRSILIGAVVKSKIDFQLNVIFITVTQSVMKKKRASEIVI